MAGYFPSVSKPAMKGVTDYSTTEVKTSQKWIDGKDIYMITFQDSEVCNSSTNATKLLPGTAIPDLDHVIKMEVETIFGDINTSIHGVFVLPTTYVSGSDLANFFQTTCNSSGITISYRNVTANLRRTGGIITVFYTKSV